MNNSSGWHPETIAVHGLNQSGRYGEIGLPLYLNSGFSFDSVSEMSSAFSGNSDHLVYSRWNNPNTDDFIAKICALESADDGYATASGMAAVLASFLGCLKAGDRILASDALFGTTQVLLNSWLPKWDIHTDYFSADNPQSAESLINSKTRMIYIETPSNPTLKVLDMEYFGNLANKMNLLLNVDNCFASPVLQKPLDWGAHIVTHSATKFIDGHGRVLGGIVVGKKPYIQDIISFCKLTGPVMSAFNAWLLSSSLTTLQMRMMRHSDTALYLAKWMESMVGLHVVYPFLPTHPSYSLARKQMSAGGALLTLQTNLSLEQADTFISSLQLIRLAANLGDSVTIITHPWTSTHSGLSDSEKLTASIYPGTFRLSVGLEHPEDIKSDLTNAFKSVGILS
jgi:O-succinylhomoserine sulfhydrylase